MLISTRWMTVRLTLPRLPEVDISVFMSFSSAKAEGISTVLLYRYAGLEFQALRAQLPGVHRVRDEAMSELRQKNAELRQQLQEAQEKLRATALSELDEAIHMIELLEEENLHLR